MRWWRATLNSKNGLILALRSERAVREEVVAVLLAIPLAFVVATTAMRAIELISVVALVLVVELLNSAVEKLADRVTLERDPQIGAVKDIGSAAVGVTLLMALAFWIFAVFERLG